VVLIAFVVGTCEDLDMPDKLIGWACEGLNECYTLNPATVVELWKHADAEIETVWADLPWEVRQELAAW